MRKVVVTMEIDVDLMSEQELTEAGFEKAEDLDPHEDEWPTFDDATPKEIVAQIPSILMLEENKQEILAGTGIFLKLGDMRVTAAIWRDKDTAPAPKVEEKYPDRPKTWFALGTQGKVSLLCEVMEYAGPATKFHVQNGAWNGILKDGVVTVLDTSKEFKVDVLWQNDRAPPGRDYNEAIGWVEEHLAGKHDGIPPSARFASEQDDLDEDDEIPF